MRLSCCWITIRSVYRSGQSKIIIQTIVERYTQLKAVKYIDEIIPYTTEKDIEDILEMYLLMCVF